MRKHEPSTITKIIFGHAGIENMDLRTYGDLLTRKSSNHQFYATADRKG